MPRSHRSSPACAPSNRECANAPSPGSEVSTMLAEGCERPSYPPIVGSGFNSTVLHYSENSNTMRKGDVVVIDAAGEYSMYASDLTRTMPVDGHFTARQKEIYNIVLGAQQAARDAFVAGKSKMGSVDHRGADAESNLLDKVAFDYINTHGKDLHGEPLGKYFIHTLGHSVGIDVHDPYDYDKPFRDRLGVHHRAGHLHSRREDRRPHRRYLLRRRHGKAHRLCRKTAAHARGSGSGHALQVAMLLEREPLHSEVGQLKLAWSEDMERRRYRGALGYPLVNRNCTYTEHDQIRVDPSLQ